MSDIHSMLRHYGITPENGFNKTFNTDVVSSIGIILYQKINLICMGKDYGLYELTKDLYYCKAINTYCISFYIYNSTVISESKCLEILKDYCEKSIYYKNYDKSRDFFKISKQINSTNMHYEHHNLVNSIKSKLNIHCDININILLHGKPGTGKSSFVEHIATSLNRSVYVMPNIGSDALETAIKCASEIKKGIFLIPEIDKDMSPTGELSQSETALLEFLNGCYTPPNAIIIMTCNDIKRFKANHILSRPGRVHFELKFGNITAEHIPVIVNKFYPDYADFTMFDKFIGAITISEFASAIQAHFILDKPLDKKFEIARISEQLDTGLYY